MTPDIMPNLDSPTEEYPVGTVSRLTAERDAAIGRADRLANEALLHNASHPRLVERLDNQRKEITRLTAERDAAIARADRLANEALLHNAMLKGANDHALDMKERAEKAEAHMREVMRVVPVGNITAHTPENMPAKVGYFVSEFARLDVENEQLQAIVDRLQGDDRMKRFDLNLPSQFVPHTAEENAAMEAALAAKGDGQ